jgi:hypothetical protein
VGDQRVGDPEIHGLTLLRADFRRAGGSPHEPSPCGDPLCHCQPALADPLAPTSTLREMPGSEGAAGRLASKPAPGSEVAEGRLGSDPVEGRLGIEPAPGRELTTGSAGSEPVEPDEPVLGVVPVEGDGSDGRLGRPVGPETQALTPLLDATTDPLPAGVVALPPPEADTGVGTDGTLGVLMHGNAELREVGTPGNAGNPGRVGRDVRLGTDVGGAGAFWLAPLGKALNAMAVSAATPAAPALSRIVRRYRCIVPLFAPARHRVTSAL